MNATREWELVRVTGPSLIRKMIAEGGLKEVITLTFLGWRINIRLFNIALPREKVTAWTAEIKAMQKNRKRDTLKDLPILIGKLNHVCFIIPDARNFMNNLKKWKP